MQAKFKAEVAALAAAKGAKAPGSPRLVVFSSEEGRKWAVWLSDAPHLTSPHLTSTAPSGGDIDEPALVAQMMALHMTPGGEPREDGAEAAEVPAAETAEAAAAEEA